MNQDYLVLIICVGVLFTALISNRLERFALTPPMIFVVLGILIGPMALQWVTPDLDALWLKSLAEVSLALILFSDASQIKRSHLLRHEGLPLRLLLIGLPLMIVLGTVVAWWLLGLTWIMAALLSTMLAPTDAALAQNVLSNRRIPEHLRNTVAAESGLNDGLALPVLIILLSIMSQSSQQDTALESHWWWLFISQIGGGILVGIAFGYVGGYLLEKAIQSDWMLPVFQRLSSLALALLIFSICEHLGANGFIAVFMAGLFLQHRSEVVLGSLKEFGEAEGQLLSLLMFFFFGLLLFPTAIHAFSWEILCYALLSLTLIRLVPVMISLIGSHTRLSETLFLGWSGPRGIASVLYLLLWLEQSKALDGEKIESGLLHSGVITHAVTSQITSTVVLTIILSIFLHGWSAKGWLVFFRHR